MSDDNPIPLARTAHSMAEFGNAKINVDHPWWSLAAAVEGLGKLATEPGPMQEVATVAMQAMAAIYNRRTGE